MSEHLTIAPIVIPLLAGALMLVAGDGRTLRPALGMTSMLCLLIVSVVLLVRADAPAAGGAAAVSIYRIGDWPVSFGIVLVLDRLSALMVALTSVLGLAALVFSLARWHRAGAHFHPLLQFQVMGLNGAFLTGDIFNLFVFFEVMLAASYGMALHGSGSARVRAGLHYLVVNLAASLLFLIGVSMLYGIVGTLNMADLASRIARVPAQDRALMEAGAAILGVAFLIKAGIWPLGFWLPGTYAAASAPAAAILSILSKVGVYAVLRLWLLLFGEAAGDSAGFGREWLLAGGLLTIGFGSVAVLATQNLPRLAGASLIVSSGTLFAAIGMGQAAVTGGALFYMASSILAIAALFLLIELVERGRDLGADVLAVTREAIGEGEDEEKLEEEVGVVIPGTMVVLGLSFIGCGLLLAGMPPLPGFLAKFAILSPLFNGDSTPSPVAWTLLAALLASGLAMIIAISRAGVEAFWASPAQSVPRVHVVEIAPVALLLGLSLALTVQAGPVMRYMEATANFLHTAPAYVRHVLPPVEGGGK